MPRSATYRGRRTAEPQSAVRSPTGERVPLALAKLPDALRGLAVLLPEGAPRSFNHDYAEAWIRVDKGFEHLAKQAVEEAEALS